MDMDDIKYAVGDFADGMVDFGKAAVGITFAVARAFPLITGGALFAVGLLGVIVMVDGPARTVPQQITYRATHGGSTYWAMQENGTNSSGFLDMPSYGNKKQEADFDQALKFCGIHKGYTGCAQVIKAASEPDIF